MQPRDPRTGRPVPGDRGSWSHGPISRVQPRPASLGVALPVAPPQAAPAAPVRRGATLAPPPAAVAGRPGFGLPSLRRNVCPHFFMTGSRGAIPIQAPHLLKALLRQPSNVSRCQIRTGVHLDEGYVNDVCLTPRFNQCVFYEDELTRR